MMVFILGRLQSMPGGTLILQEIDRECLGTGLGEARSQGVASQPRQRPPGGLPRFPTAVH